MIKTKIDSVTENSKFPLPEGTAKHTKAGDGAANILIVDNDNEAIRCLLTILARKGIHAILAGDKKTALDIIDKNYCNLVFTSNNLAGGQTETEQDRESFELLRQIKINSPELPVIMMGKSSCVMRDAYCEKEKTHDTIRNTQYAIRDMKYAVETAVRAMYAGCCDFLIKPLENEKIEALLDTLLPNHGVCTIASEQQGGRLSFQIVGRSPKLIQTIKLAEKVAPTSVPVLINGESGTGKELISFLIHHKSKRALAPYIRVNCAGLSESLLESELFGHEKGAFTGAYAQRKGRFEMADGGTLLLDEITETPPNFQAKLLRILEQQEFERVGGNENVRINVRIISTTNKDLTEEIRQGRFRQDLYYRLSAVRLIVPPVRNRLEDLPELVWHFVNLYAHQTQRRITKLDPAMMDIFARYHWPGNVRQLKNVVLTSLILGSGPVLSLADVSWLFDELQPLTQPDSSYTQTRPEQSRGDAIFTTQYAARNTQYELNLGGIPLEQIEKQAILDTLHQTAGNQTKAAKALGISDRTLRDKIRRYRKDSCLVEAG